MFDTTQRKPDYLLLTVVGILVPFGLVMVYSASFMDALANYGSHMYYAWRQLAGLIIGTVALLFVQRLDYRVWRSYSVHLLAVTLILLLLVLILPEKMTTVNGARSWIIIGGTFSMQPSELAKLALVVYFADWLSRRGSKISNVTYGLIPFAVMLGVICGMVMIGGDLGTTIVLVMIAGTVYFTAGANLLHIAGAVAVAAGAFWAMVKIAPYRQERIAAWLDPFANYQDAGYQPVHALYALGSGGLLGQGLGQGRQKYLWLPQAHTDAIFAIVGEEFGLVGTLFVVGCFLLIAYRGFRIAARAPEPFAALLATGLTSWLVFQALINIAVVTTLLPFTGLTLPFLSYGSSSLIMCMVATGVLLSISRHTVERSPGDQNNAVSTFLRPAQSVADFIPVWWRDRRPRLSRAGGRGGTAGQRARRAAGPRRRAPRGGGRAA